VTHYLALVLGGMWDAELVLSPDAQNLFAHVFGLRAQRMIEGQATIEAFSEIIRSHLPEFQMSIRGECWTCARAAECDKHALKEIEKKVKGLLFYRNYDEIMELKSVFSDVRTSLGSLPAPELKADLIRQFTDREAALQSKLRGTFPKVSRWSALTTMVSIPIVVAGVTSQLPLIAGVGAALAGAAQITKQYVDYLTSKHRWVFFRQSATDADVPDKRSAQPTDSGDKE